MTIEKIVLKNLIKNEDFTKRVLPFLRSDYFHSDEDRVLFEEIGDFVVRYSAQPTFDALKIAVNNKSGMLDTTVKNIEKSLDEFKADNSITNQDWLIKSAEEFCQEKALYNAIMSSIEVMKGKGAVGKGAIPDMLSKALSVSFDNSIGHDFLDDFMKRYEYYHRIEEKIPFDLDYFNRITKNGIPRKTLNVVMGGVHSGKSLFLCHFAAGYLAQGKNVLYITLEMSEEEIAKRIDTNLLNISFDDLARLPKDLYNKKVSALASKTNGKLIIKEYPATSASVQNFKALLNELKLKKKFTPDVIIVDYLNLCSSSRLKSGNASDTYVYVKAIAEELRGLAQLTGIPIWSATQLNRSGMNNSDPDMTNTAESIGLPATCDLMLALIVNDDFRALNQIMVKQLKNRYNDMELDKKFMVGVDKTKMRLYDVEPSAQKAIINPTPVPVPVIQPKPSMDGKPKPKPKIKIVPEQKAQYMSQKREKFKSLKVG